MLHIPVLQELAGRDNSPSVRAQAIIQFKELEPDWERYNAWRASLVESYSSWLKRRRKLRLAESK